MIIGVWLPSMILGDCDCSLHIYIYIYLFKEFYEWILLQKQSIQQREKIPENLSGPFPPHLSTHAYVWIHVLHTCLFRLIAMFHFHQFRLDIDDWTHGMYENDQNENFMSLLQMKKVSTFRDHSSQKQFLKLRVTTSLYHSFLIHYSLFLSFPQFFRLLLYVTNIFSICSYCNFKLYNYSFNS